MQKGFQRRNFIKASPKIKYRYFQRMLNLDSITAIKNVSKDLKINNAPHLKKWITTLKDKDSVEQSSPNIYKLQFQNFKIGNICVELKAQLALYCSAISQGKELYVPI